MPASLAPAESGDGDRVDVVRLETPQPERPNDFDRLKTILFGDERGTLDALDARVERIEGAVMRVAAELRDEKVGREDLAALLAELALRLKGDFELPPAK